jgi:hypothetical protein
MKTTLLSFLLLPLYMFGQCPNDVCELSTEIPLCEIVPLSINCQTDWGNQDIVLYGSNCNSPYFTIDEDQWFTFTLDSLSLLTIDLNTNYAAPPNSLPCPTNQNGTTEGINIILWTGDNCGNMFPIINTWASPWCNGYYIIPECIYSPTICQNGCSHGIATLPNNIDTSSPAYIATTYLNSTCCFNWFNNCNFIYNQQLSQYNASLNTWIVEQTNYLPQGVVPDTNPQDYIINLALPEGNYWIQLDPISCNPNTGGYSSEGTGTINVCPTFFLNLEESPNVNELPKTNEYLLNPKRYMHPLYGLLVILPDGRSVDMMGRQITTYGVDFE